MQRTWCDNCEKEIRHEPDEINKNNPDWKPDKHFELRGHIVGTGKYPIMMDLCMRCARGYVKALSEPIEV